MKKLLIICILFFGYLLNIDNIVQAREAYSILTFINSDSIQHDKKTGNWIVKPNPELNVLHIIFNKYGEIIHLGNKSIKYKNNIISQIGNDYVTYLNDKFYTIGGKRVEFDETGFHVTKIGDMSVEEYFTGRNLPESEYREMGSRTMILNLRSNGIGIGGTFNGIIIPFE